MKESMQVWITKYALTQGLYQVTARDCFETADGMIEQIEPKIMFGYFHKPDWHESRTEAVERAEKMRSNRIANLRKQIAKLEKMDF